MSRESLRRKHYCKFRHSCIVNYYNCGNLVHLNLHHKRYISSPLLKLQESASSIAHGNLDTFVDKSSRNEIGLLAKHLDIMRGSIKQLFVKLQESKEKLEDYSRTLEQKVETRTLDLARTVEELKALGDVSQTVNSTLDLETVLTRIVRHAVQISIADAGTIYELMKMSRYSSLG